MTPTDTAPQSPLALLLEVQTLDTRIDHLDHRHATLPERAELAALEPERQQVVGEIAAGDAERDQLMSRQRKLEAEIQDLDARIAEDDRRLYGGTVKAMREIEALQHEIETAKERRSDAETEVLEILETLEGLEDAQQDRARRLAEVDRRRAEVEERMAGVEAEIASERSAAVAARDAAAAGVPEDLLSTYSTYRKSLDGLVVARFEGGNCHGCPLSMPATEADRVKHLPPDEIAVCGECGRYLLR